MNTENLLHANLKVRIKNNAESSDFGNSNYKIISVDIFNKTGNYLSQTTIKRYFEDTDTKFSTFVLNSLAQYVGYNDWENFRKANSV